MKNYKGKYYKEHLFIPFVVLCEAIVGNWYLIMVMSSMMANGFSCVSTQIVGWNGGHKNISQQRDGADGVKFTHIRVLMKVALCHS